MMSGVGPRNHALDGWTHWRHLANTVKRLSAVAMSESATRIDYAAVSKLLWAGQFCFIIAVDLVRSVPKITNGWK